MMYYGDMSLIITNRNKPYKVRKYVKRFNSVVVRLRAVNGIARNKTVINSI